MSVIELRYRSRKPYRGRTLELCSVYGTRGGTKVDVVIRQADATTLPVWTRLPRSEALRLFHALGDVLAAEPPTAARSRDEGEGVGDADR